jgi:hypothetical protein
LSAPDRIGVEEGWRVWRVGSDEGRPRLLSQAMQRHVWWPHERARAVCYPNNTLPWPPEAPREQLPPAHRPPVQGCNCGFYALDSFRAIMGIWASDFVLGRVQLWGKIIRGERGLRAEFAYPAELIWMGGRAAKHLETLAGEYGVPLRPLSAEELALHEQVTAERREKYAIEQRLFRAHGGRGAIQQMQQALLAGGAPSWGTQATTPPPHTHFLAPPHGPLLTLQASKSKRGLDGWERLYGSILLYAVLLFWLLSIPHFLGLY